MAQISHLHGHEDFTLALRFSHYWSDKLSEIGLFRPNRRLSQPSPEYSLEANRRDQIITGLQIPNSTGRAKALQARRPL